MTALQSKLGEFASTWEAGSAPGGGSHSTRGHVQVQAHTGACSGLYMPFAAGGAGPQPDSSLLLCPGWRWHTPIELQNLPLQCLLHHPKPHFTDRKTEAVKVYDDRAKPHPGKKKQAADVYHVLSLHSPSLYFFSQAWTLLVWSCWTACSLCSASPRTWVPLCSDSLELV